MLKEDKPRERGGVGCEGDVLSEGWMAEVFDHIPLGLMVVGSDSRVLHANQLALSLDVKGDALPQGVEACVEAGGGDQTRYRRAGNDEVFIETRHRLPSEGDALTLIVRRVITEQTRMEARLLLQERLAAFGLIAAGVAHELGNPIASAEVSLQLLSMTEGLPSEALGAINDVRAEVRRMQRAVRELVDFARRRGEHGVWTNVRQVVDDALRLLRYDARFRGVALTVRHDLELPPLAIDEDNLMQVVLNILLNALDAMPEEGVLEVWTQHGDGYVSLFVRDSGVGMDAETLSRCLEPCFTTKAQGTGLGLNLCKRILNDVNGQLTLESLVGHGTTVEVRVPLGRLEQPSETTGEGDAA